MTDTGEDALREELVEQVKSITGMENADMARHLLEACDWSVEAATSAYFDDTSGPAGTAAQPLGLPNNNVPAPLPSTGPQRLVDAMAGEDMDVDQDDEDYDPMRAALLPGVAPHRTPFVPTRAVYKPPPDMPSEEDQLQRVLAESAGFAARGAAQPAGAPGGEAEADLQRVLSKSQEDFALEEERLLARAVAMSSTGGGGVQGAGTADDPLDVDEVYDPALRAAIEASLQGDDVSEANVAEMGVRDLKELIERGGLDASDCIEVDDLRARALEALGKLNADKATAREAEGALEDAGAETAAMRAQLEAQLRAHARQVAGLHSELNGGAGLGGFEGSADDYPGYTRRAPVPTQRDLLRQEQDREYEESLALDRAREESMAAEAAREAAELEAIKRAEEEVQAQVRAKAEAAVANVHEMRARLPVEPAKGTAGAVAVLARLPDGGRLQRLFERTHSVGAIYDWVTVSWADKAGPDAVPDFALVTNMPRREHTDRTRTLVDAGLGERQCMLFVEPKDP